MMCLGPNKGVGRKTVGRSGPDIDIVMKPGRGCREEQAGWRG